MAGGMFFFLLYRSFFWNGKYGSGKRYGKGVGICFSYFSCAYRYSRNRGSGLCAYGRDETDCCMDRKAGSCYGSSLSVSSRFCTCNASRENRMGISLYGDRSFSSGSYVWGNRGLYGWKNFADRSSKRDFFQRSRSWFLSDRSCTVRCKKSRDTGNVGNCRDFCRYDDCMYSYCACDSCQWCV